MPSQVFAYIMPVAFSTQVCGEGTHDTDCNLQALTYWQQRKAASGPLLGTSPNALMQGGQAPYPLMLHLPRQR